MAHEYIKFKQDLPRDVGEHLGRHASWMAVTYQEIELQERHAWLDDQLARFLYTYPTLEGSRLAFYLGAAFGSALERVESTLIDIAGKG